MIGFSGSEIALSVHARASECRREGAYAVVLNDGINERVVVSRKVTGYGLTSIRAHLLGVIAALELVPEGNQKIMLFSNLEAFVAPFQAHDLRNRFLRGTLANPDLWVRIISLCASRRVEVRAVSMRSCPPEDMVHASKISEDTFRNPELEPEIDVEPEYPDLFSNINI